MTIDNPPNYSFFVNGKPLKVTTKFKLKTNNLEVGKDINTHGKRLFFQDLFVGKIVLANYSTDLITTYKVCKIVDNYECLERKGFLLDDGYDTPSLGLPDYSENAVNGNDKHSWLFELPDYYREII